MILRPSIPVRSVPADPELSRLEHDEREVLACFHCRLVQYRTGTSLCRRCHKPLQSEVRNRTVLEPACVRSDSARMNISDPTKNLGVRVRRIRNERGLTQLGLADRMNVPRTYISKVEMGRVVPTLTTLGAHDGSGIRLVPPGSKKKQKDVPWRTTTPKEQPLQLSLFG